MPQGPSKSRRNGSRALTVASLMLAACAGTPTTKPVVETSVRASTKPTVKASSTIASPETEPSSAGESPGGVPFTEPTASTATSSSSPTVTSSAKVTPSATPATSATATPGSTATPVPGGVATTISLLAGGTTGTTTIGAVADGVGAAAVFPQNSLLTGLAFEPTTEEAPSALWLTEQSSADKLVRISMADGTTTTITLTGADTKLSLPACFASDGPRGRMYVSDYLNHRILAITPQGAVSVIAGSGKAGYRDSTSADPTAVFNHPAGLVLSQDTLYVADSGNNCIRAIDLAFPGLASYTGTVAGLAGTAGAAVDGVSTAAARFNAPMGIAAQINGTTSAHLYVADSANSCIRAIDLLAKTVSVYAGKPSVPGDTDGAVGTATFDTPETIVSDGLGNLFVGDLGANSHRVREIDATRKTLSFSGTSTPGVGNTGYQNVLGLCPLLGSDGSVKTMYAYDCGPDSFGLNQPFARVVKIARQ